MPALSQGRSCGLLGLLGKTLRCRWPIGSQRPLPRPDSCERYMLTRTALRSAVDVKYGLLQHAPYAADDSGGRVMAM